MRTFFSNVKGIISDGRGDWKFYYSVLTFTVALLGVLDSLFRYDVFILISSSLNFVFAAYYGIDFWKRNENSRRIRRWKRRQSSSSEAEED